MCGRFDLGGIRFNGIGTSLSPPEDPLILMVWNQTRKVYTYFSSNPTFDRTNTDRALPQLAPPVIDEAFVNKLLDYAIARDWGQRER